MRQRRRARRVPLQSRAGGVACIAGGAAMRGRVMGGLAEYGIGEVFAQRYVIERVLGEGDRKRTYLAKDKKLERLVALSFVKPDAVLSDPEGTEREARVLGRIGSHDNIVSLY